jgi:hypothetical protein
VRRLGVVLVALLLAVPAARADSGATVRARLLSEVDSGLTAVNARWAWQGWYQDYRGTPGWSSIWDTEHLFQAYVALAKASPTTRHRNMLVWFAEKSDTGYFNPQLGNGIGGFSTGYGHHGEQGQQWFDDNGWLGLSFMDAWRLTHLRRFLDDAEVAFRYLYTVGWDPLSGGIWWNTQETVKAAESVNTAALLAVELFEAQAGASYLAAAERLIDWADDNLLDPRSGLYLNHPDSGVSISYLESPMLSVFTRLCRDRQEYCNRVAPLTRAILARFGGDLHQPPAVRRDVHPLPARRVRDLSRSTPVFGRLGERDADREERRRRRRLLPQGMGRIDERDQSRADLRRRRRAGGPGLDGRRDLRRLTARRHRALRRA